MRPVSHYRTREGLDGGGGVEGPAPKAGFPNWEILNIFFQLLLGIWDPTFLSGYRGGEFAHGQS